MRNDALAIGEWLWWVIKDYVGRLRGRPPMI